MKISKSPWIMMMLLVLGASAHAQDRAKAEEKKAVREKMELCNKQADEKKLKGDARVKFRSECLKG